MTNTDHTDDDAELPTVLEVPIQMVEQLFEPWDALDSAIAQLEHEVHTNKGVSEPVAAIVAARDALRSPFYAVMRGYRAIAYPPEPDEPAEAA